MKYSNAEEIKIGDIVSIENKKTLGVVEDIIDSTKQKEYWGVNEYGVIIKSDPLGLVFWPIDDEDKVCFIDRAK